MFSNFFDSLFEFFFSQEYNNKFSTSNLNATLFFYNELDHVV